MKAALAGLALIALSLGTARAGDKALVLNDDEQKQLVQVIDAAMKGYGAQVGRQGGHLLDRLDSAPSVVPHKEEPEDKK